MLRFSDVGSAAVSWASGLKSDSEVDEGEDTIPPVLLGRCPGTESEAAPLVFCRGLVCGDSVDDAESSIGASMISDTTTVTEFLEVET